MALQWIAVASITALELLLLVVVSIPLPRKLRLRVAKVVEGLWRPIFAVIPFMVFQLAEVVVKFERRLICKNDVCTSSDRDRFEKSMARAQRNGILTVVGLVCYWLLYRFITIQQCISQLENDKSKSDNEVTALRKELGGLQDDLEKKKSEMREKLMLIEKLEQKVDLADEEIARNVNHANELEQELRLRKHSTGAMP
ncbi:hypothetical protein CBR_g31214 [Chara braunii]|uniref:Endoplasmic reticulum transmembrane protein n=1 Tax=Chara braunii TaxID=69332 RepID=A0A388JXT0_CHABU|nr:hypothetical protein CBR_g31214 [Chara braunii]|eukprot:GBG62578.1 hypothetical protein CBR_g31214 [Chara braunii]